MMMKMHHVEGFLAAAAIVVKLTTILCLLDAEVECVYDHPVTELLSLFVGQETEEYGSNAFHQDFVASDELYHRHQHKNREYTYNKHWAHQSKDQISQNEVENVGDRSIVKDSG